MYQVKLLVNLTCTRWNITFMDWIQPINYSMEINLCKLKFLKNYLKIKWNVSFVRINRFFLFSNSHLKFTFVKWQASCFSLVTILSHFSYCQSLRRYSMNLVSSKKSSFHILSNEYWLLISFNSFLQRMWLIIVQKHCVSVSREFLPILWRCI